MTSAHCSWEEFKLFWSWERGTLFAFIVWFQTMIRIQSEKWFCWFTAACESIILTSINNKIGIISFLINVPSSWTLLLILLLLSVADKTFSAIFRDFNVSYRQTFWRIQPFLMWIGRACCSGKEPNLLLPLQVISAFYKIVSIMKCVALGTKITKNN